MRKPPPPVKSPGLRVLVEVLGADEPALGRGVELTRHVEGGRTEGPVGPHELRRQPEELGQRDADRLGAREERVAVEQRGARGRVDLDHRVDDLEHVRVVGAQALVRRLTLELVAVAGVAGVEMVGALPRGDQAESAAAADRGVPGPRRRGDLALADGLAALGLVALELVSADVVGVDGIAATRQAMLVLGRDRSQVARRADEAQRRGAAGDGCGTGGRHERGRERARAGDGKHLPENGSLHRALPLRERARGMSAESDRMPDRILAYRPFDVAEMGGVQTWRGLGKFSRGVVRRPDAEGAP